MIVYEDVGFVLMEIGLRFRGCGVYPHSAVNGTGLLTRLMFYLGSNFHQFYPAQNIITQLYRGCDGRLIGKYV